MIQFKLQLQTTMVGLPWEYDFGMASRAMAEDYAKRVIGQQFGHVSWFMGATLFMKRPNEDWIPLAGITIDEPEARITKAF